MTSSVPRFRGPSQAVDLRPSATKSAAQTRLHPTAAPFVPEARRRRGPHGEAVVVIDHPPPMAQLVISFRHDGQTAGAAGVTVQLQAIPCVAELEDDSEQATLVFDRTPAFSHALATGPAANDVAARTEGALSALPSPCEA